MTLYHCILRPLLFRLSPEAAHRLAFLTLAPIQKLREHLDGVPPPSSAMLRQTVFGLDFPNPIGLGAGFDKNAERPHVWGSLGFGFAELGTITARAQPGNPRPRVFRLPLDHAIINRFGFNNDGAEAVARSLAARLARRRPAGPLGINIGKSRVTPADEAGADYAESFRAFFPFADYLVVNVSSPNTPGLRSLQAAEQLEPILALLQMENRRLALAHATAPRPLLVKLAPDLSEQELHAIVEVALRCEIAGLVATNTTLQRPIRRTPPALAEQAGGLSGGPLRELSTRVVRLLFRCSGGRLPIIGVGGIFTAGDAYEKIRAGATLVQLYTGFVYQGPTLPRRLASGLSVLLARDGFHHVGQAVGIDA